MQQNRDLDKSEDFFHFFEIKIKRVACIWNNKKTGKVD
ncbi:hypothetical protein RV09_GL002963 [Enterococcus moraviensis]|nr:hypothetical protein RV09_GL002963 [Enterococcus moraviensis]